MQMQATSHALSAAGSGCMSHMASSVLSMDRMRCSDKAAASAPKKLSLCSSAILRQFCPFMILVRIIGTCAQRNLNFSTLLKANDMQIQLS